LYHCNGPNITLVHNLLLNSKVLIWRKSGNWTGPYYLLAIEGKTCRVQLPSGLTNFRTTFIKPYFWFKTTYNNKLNKLDKLKTPLPTLEPTLKPTKPAKPTIPPPIKCG
jgi:hypothetical protein